MSYTTSQRVPKKKSAAIDSDTLTNGIGLGAFIDESSKPVPDMTIKEAIAQSVCIDCGTDVTLDEFENQWSWNEYLLTARCQDCQPTW